jgi:signal transduction histidine kinase/HAMP domain-containing protein
LLTASLILTILPLALVGWYAIRQHRIVVQQHVATKLDAVAILKARTLGLWLEDCVTMLNLVAQEPENARETAWAQLQRRVPGLLGGVRLAPGGEAAWKIGRCGEELPADAVTVQMGDGDVGSVRLCLAHATLQEMLRIDAGLGETGRIYLVHDEPQWLDESDEEVPGIASAVAALANGDFGLNVEEGDIVSGYARVPGTDLGVFVEEAQAEVLASTDQIAATFIAVILGGVLLTTFIAAVGIRQITRPVIRLTESALAMANGELEQSVAVTSRDEIGILTYVFNQMAAELKSLYDDLEAKVVERTRKLQQANYQIQRRALQLAASLEVSQAVTSVRDPDVLLNRVADLIRDRFLYASVAVYLLEPGGGQARMHAVSPKDADWPESVRTGDGSVVERAMRKGAPQISNHPMGEPLEWYERTLSRVAVPFKMEERVLGVVAVLSTEREGIQADDLSVLEHLANQVAIALENARAYERERLAAQQLEEAEAFKSRFLANMSHALREPLNSITGFSRLMLKGLDGELNGQQQADLQRIHDNGKRLLSLINDILAISQIQAGLMELQLKPVDICEVFDSVMPTAEALVRGNDIELVQDTAQDLPLVQADPTRLRQVLLRLLTNAAKFTEEGRIILRAWADEEQAYVSVSDTGIGIPLEDRERIFARFEKGSSNGHPSQGAGLGLALSKEFVEMHGGRIWLESAVGEGSTFTFSVPRLPKDEESWASVATQEGTYAQN